MIKKLLEKLESIERKLTEQNLLQKEIINFVEACLYLDLSSSYMYKLTSLNLIPCYAPMGKKLFFKRSELDNWLTSSRSSTIAENEQMAADYIVKKSRAKK